ncbi:hypothetical protein [Parapedobacter sp. DT-150]|uniref:hypothetical protein n=1 Tax=Parapedobacter sp. DT-150 TaxID=3396162 RepID=UPI003F19DA86
MKKLTLILFTLAFGLVGHTQTDPTNYIRTDLIGPSPNASSIGKLGEVPVSLYTGLPNISIPIYEIKDQDISLPITLIYNYDGFKPRLPSSWVGMGWTLEAGGVITRNVRDKVDELGVQAGTFDTISNILNLAETNQTFLKNAVKDVLVDTEPDIFSFNFCGYSGKFILYRDKFYCLPDQKIKIEGAPNTSGFIITIADGVKYYFQKMETSTPKGNAEASYNIPTHPSSWYLTKIQNAANTATINLSYVNEGQINQQGVHTQSYKYVLPLQGTSPITSQLFPKKDTYPTFVNPARLSSVTSTNCTVSFVPVSTARLDIDQGTSGSSRALSQILISAPGNSIRTFEFHQSYSATTGHNRAFMRLDSLREHGGTAGVHTHRFQYEAVPATGFTKSGAALDHYGFYLGSGDFSSNILPKDIVPNAFLDRSPKLAGTRVGALNKITYPLGGTATFTYEQNRRFDGENYNPIAYDATANVSGTPSSGQVIASFNEPFTVSMNQSVEVALTRSVHSPFADGNARNLSKDFRITRTTGGVNTIVYEGQIDFESDNNGKNFSVSLTAGTYFITAYIDYRETAMSATVTYTEEGEPSSGEAVGGLRVRQVVLNPNPGTMVTKTYTYKNEEGFSSGVSMSPQYDVKDFTDILMTPSETGEIHSRVYNSANGEFYGINTPVYYKSVLEETVSGTERLSTRHDFISFQSEGTFLGIDPLRVTVYRNEGDAKVPIQRTYYDYATVNDTIIHAIKPYLRSHVLYDLSLPMQETYDYEHYMIRKEWKYLRSIREVKYEGTDSVSSLTRYHYDTGGDRNLLFEFYANSRGENHTTRYKYPQNYTSTVASTFLAAHVLSPVIEKQVWKKNSTTDSILVSGEITQFDAGFRPSKIYRLDVPSGLAALNSQTTSGGKFTTLLSDTRYAERINFGYNGDGNLITQTLTNALPISYLWSYNGQYPVAEVKSAAQADIAYAGFEAEGKGNWSYSGATSTDATAPTGNRVYSLGGGAMAKSGLSSAKAYVLTYWAKSTSSPSVSGSSGAVVSSANAVTSRGGWTLYQRTIRSSTSVTLSGSVAVDDVRLHPLGTEMITYTYNPLVGMTSRTDASGRITLYEYDGFGRLWRAKDHFGNIMEEYRYNYRP